MIQITIRHNLLVRRFFYWYNRITYRTTVTFQPLFNFYFNVQRVLDTGEILPIFNVGETTRTFKRRKKDGDWAKAIISLGAAGIELVTQDWWEGFSLRTDKITNHDS